MSTRDEFVTLDRALRQLRLRSGDAAIDAEIVDLLDVAVEAFERRMGFNIVDAEVSGTLASKPSPGDDVVIPVGKVYGALLGASLGDLKRRLYDGTPADIGTDASAMGYVLAHPESDQPGEDIHARLDLEVRAMRDQLSVAFTLPVVRSIATAFRVALDDASYTGGNAFDTAVRIENDANALVPRAASKVVASDRYRETVLEPPSGGWSSAVVNADELRYHAFVGVPVSDIPKRWPQALLIDLETIYRARDAAFDVGNSEAVVNRLIRGDTLAQRR